MGSLKILKQFLIVDCKISSFQIWKVLNDKDFSPIYPNNPSKNFQHHKSNLYFEMDKGFAIIIFIEGKILQKKELKHLEQIIYTYYLEQMLEKEKYIRSKMMESIRDISSLNNLDDLLTKILKNSLSVIPAADMGVLWMYNPKEDILIPKAWAGGPSAEIQKMRMKIGEGIIGKTFRENKSIILTSFNDIWNESLSITIENQTYLQSSYHFEELQAIISVPIVVEETVLCVLIIYQNGPYPLLTAKDQKLLESFSDQVSIALTNSRLYQHLKEQNNILIQRDEIHHSFMNLSLQSKGLKIIANELRRMVNIPIAIIDFTDNQVYSNPNSWHKNAPVFHPEQLTTITKAEFRTFISTDQKSTFYFHPIIAINTIIGMLIAVVNENELTALDKMVFEQSSSIIALEIIRQQTLTDSFYKKISDRFHQFLQLKEYGQLCEKGLELGIQQNFFYTAVIIQLAYTHERDFMNIQIHRLVSDLKKAYSKHLPVVFGSQDKVTLLCQFPQEISMTDFENRLHHLQASWKNTNGSSLRIAVGACYENLEDIAASYSEAEKTLDFQKSRKLIGIMHYQEIGINRLFLNQPSEELHRFINEVFLPLQIDPDKNQSLEETLLAYIQNNRSISLTAKQLHIHVNTLYQRIKKIEDKLKVSFSSSEDMLKIQLACFLKQSSMAYRE